MASIVKQYTFVPDTDAKAAEVNKNFDDIIAFLNNSVVHTDGSKAMTGLLMLPATDPSDDNHAVRKAYVDARTAATGVPYALQSGKFNGSYSGDGSGGVLVAFGTPFGFTPTLGTTLAVGSNHDLIFNLQSVNPSGFSGRVFHRNSGVALSGNFTLHWIAVASNA